MMADPAPDEPLDESLPPHLWEALNLPEPQRSEDFYAPEVDRSLLRRLLGNELRPGMVQAVYRLIHAFDSWKRAYAELVTQDFRRTKSEESNPSEP